MGYQNAIPYLNRWKSSDYHILSSNQIVKYWIYRCIAFYDIPINEWLSPISPIGRIMRRSLSVTLVVNKYDFRNSKGTNRLLGKSSDRICRLNQESIMGFWLCFHYINLTVQTWIVNIICDFGSNRFRKYGKCCPPWTTLQHPAMVVTLWHNCCRLYYKYTVIYRIP